MLRRLLPLACLSTIGCPDDDARVTATDVADTHVADTHVADTHVADTHVATSDVPDAGPSGACDDSPGALTAAERALVDLPADAWWQAPGTPMRAVCPQAGYDCSPVVTAWSGGAFDPVGNDLYVWGGGHADYPGNELYAFDVPTLTWSRPTDPSTELVSQDPLPDGQPVSRHTYDGLQIMADRGVLLARGGSRWQDGSGTPLTWAFDLQSRAWTNLSPAEAPALTNCCSEGTAWDPIDRRLYVHLTSKLVRYDPDANRYEALLDFGFPPYWPRYEVWGNKRGLVDTRRHDLWIVGGGLYLVYDLDAGAVVTDAWITTGGATFDNAAHVGEHAEQRIVTGGGEVIDAPGPGVDYDRGADQIVGWVGGGAWRLDLASKVWTRGASAGAPASPVPNGTYGRWRYVPRVNAFILVNGVDEDVWFYKNAAGCSSAP